MPRHLSRAQVEEAKECYAIYGQRSGIPIGMLGVALRSLGINPTNVELRNIIREIGSPPSVSFELFKSVLSRDFPPKETPEEVREALGTFDNDGDGRISTEELKHYMMTTGEKLSKEEVDMMFREANIDDDGMISCEQFVQLMTKGQ